MDGINVIYGSSTGNTETAAELIASALNGRAISVGKAVPADFEVPLVVLGASTWGIGDLQDDWAAALPLLDRVDWNGRKVALFGLGDQISFGDSFIDGIRDIYDKLAAKGVALVGRWSTEGYSHSYSRAEVGGEFIGLALDVDNQPELTSSRVTEWCEQLRHEAGI